MKIIQERSKDFSEVFLLIEKAFLKEEHSDHQEQFLVERLRKSEAFIPELSLIAKIGNQIVGHILLTKIEIINEQDSIPSLALAPVSVLPKFQNQGIGGKLIKHSHYIARSLGYKSIALLGHPNYYPKFGYQKASKFGIVFPFEVANEYCMMLELVENGLKDVQGTIKYPKEFYE